MQNDPEDCQLLEDRSARKSYKSSDQPPQAKVGTHELTAKFEELLKETTIEDHKEDTVLHTESEPNEEMKDVLYGSCEAQWHGAPPFWM